MHRSDNDRLRQELQEAQRKIERLEQALVETQRLATVGQLACFVVHEFNNILLLIIGRAGEALRHGDNAAKEKALQKAVECGQRAADIAASVLGYATARQRESQVMTAEALMEAAVNLIAWDLPKRGIELVREYQAGAKVCVVAAKIEQVLLNLILNARSAMHGRGGRLTVAVAPADAKGFVALKVQDTGCGIPQEHIERIFDPFFTTRPRTGGNGNGQRDGGTGLGLPVARDIVRQAGGDMRVESTPGTGSTFTVLLPIAK